MRKKNSKFGSMMMTKTIEKILEFIKILIEWYVQNNRVYDRVCEELAKL